MKQMDPMKLNMAVLVAAVALAGATVESDAQPCMPLPDGIVSWWRAEDNALDSSGTNHGSATAKYEAGKVGLGFTAASSTGVTNSASLQLTNALTVEAWVKPPTNSGAANRSILSKFTFAQFK